jgi:hypothetical protein
MLIRSGYHNSKLIPPTYKPLGTMRLLLVILLSLATPLVVAKECLIEYGRSRDREDISYCLADPNDKNCLELAADFDDQPEYETGRAGGRAILVVSFKPNDELTATCSKYDGKLISEREAEQLIEKWETTPLALEDF